jgi:hypothetical protein
VPLKSASLITTVIGKLGRIENKLKLQKCANLRIKIEAHNGNEIFLHVFQDSVLEEFNFLVQIYFAVAEMVSVA